MGKIIKNRETRSKEVEKILNEVFLKIEDAELKKLESLKTKTKTK
jgi:hypothetical protein